MSQVFDQDAPETQLGFREAQEEAERLHAELLQEIDTTGGESAGLPAETRLDAHLIKFRHLLCNQEQWSLDYRVIDGQQAEPQELNLRKDNDLSL